MRSELVHAPPEHLIPGTGRASEIPVCRELPETHRLLIHTVVHLLCVRCCAPGRVFAASRTGLLVASSSWSTPRAKDPGLHPPRYLIHSWHEALLAAHVPANSYTSPRRHRRITHQPEDVQNGPAVLSSTKIVLRSNTDSRCHIITLITASHQRTQYSEALVKNVRRTRHPSTILLLCPDPSGLQNLHLLKVASSACWKDPSSKLLSFVAPSIANKRTFSRRVSPQNFFDLFRPPVRPSRTDGRKDGLTVGQSIGRRTDERMDGCQTDIARTDGGLGGRTDRAKFPTQTDQIFLCRQHLDEFCPCPPPPRKQKCECCIDVFSCLRISSLLAPRNIPPASSFSKSEARVANENDNDNTH